MYFEETYLGIIILVAVSIDQHPSDCGRKALNEIVKEREMKFSGNDLPEK